MFDVFPDPVSNGWVQSFLFCHFLLHSCPRELIHEVGLSRNGWVRGTTETHLIQLVHRRGYRSDFIRGHSAYFEDTIQDFSVVQL